MILQDLHIHTTFCDGKDVPEKIVLAAIKKGFQRIGFSGHSYTFFDESYCMSRDGTMAYKKEIARLREKYAGDIEIFCGIEQDYWCREFAEGYDYIIGSVHYLRIDQDKYIPVDESADMLNLAAERYFGGDIYALAEEYFATVANVVKKTGAGIIGHFDLISKFNENGALFDESSPRYTAAWKMAADKLIAEEVPFEINTGAISRGYRTHPYPSDKMVQYIKSRGGRFILSGDSHSADTLGFEFDKWEKLL